MVSRSGIKISYFLRAPCAQTNPPSKPSWRQRPFCQSCSSPTCCEEAQKAKQCKQKVCCSQTIQREGANCLCAWYRSQPPGAQRCLDPVWPTAGRAQCVDQMYPGQI